MKRATIILFIWSLIITLNYAQIEYECTVTQEINGSNLYVSIYIISTGSTNFILGGANFVLNVDTSGLNLTNVPGEISEGLWDNGNDPDNYADQLNSRSILAGWVGINIDYLLTGLGVQVPSTTTLIGTMSIPIKSTSFNSGVVWRVTGLSDTEILDSDFNDITSSGTFTNPPDFALPVELASFTASVYPETVNLNWVTKTEVNNYGFNVERRINEGEWNSIGFVEGHGNSNSPKEYSYADKDLFAGGSSFQYRLKQVDTDGQFEYSDVVEVEIVPTQFELSQNYPNPFNPTTTIRFSLPQATQIKLTLYNMIGEQVAVLAEGMYETGNHKVTFNASSASGGLPSGAYVYRLESSDPSTGSGQSFVQVKKMILMK